MRAPLLLVPLLLLAGCLDAPQGSPGGAGNDDPAGGDAADGGTRRLGGSFTAEATQAQVQEAQGLAAAEGGDMAILESFPLQFAVSGLGADACGRLHAALDAKPYVASVRACEEMRADGDPDTPTGTASSPPATGAGPGAWGFRGSFTQDFTDEDARAVCEAAGRGEDCAMMKSYPPQYAFSYPAREACEEARARVLAVPHVAGVTECRAQG